MKTARIGRRLGDWLGVVPDEDAPQIRPAEIVADVAAPARQPAPAPLPAPAPVVPDHAVVAFRDVVNRRRAAGLDTHQPRR